MTKPKKKKKSKPYQITKNKYLSDAALEHLKILLRRYKDTDLRNTTLIRLILDTGARSQEALNITKGDIDLNKGTVFIRGLKNSRDRELPMNQSLIERIKPLLKGKDLKDRVFNISRVMLYKIWQGYKPEHKGIHSLRHTFAINLYKKTKDIRLVQTALGHTSISSTMVYSEYLYSNEELKRILSNEAEE